MALGPDGSGPSANELLVPVRVISVAADRSFQPGSETNVGAAGRGTSRAAGARWTSPVILRGVDSAGTNTRTIQRTNVADTNLAAPEVVEMDIDFSRSVDGDVDVLVSDNILRDDRPDYRRAASAAVDVNSDAARRGGIVRIREISGNGVANDLVVGEIIRRQPKGRTDVGMHSHTAKTIVR